MSLGAEYKRTTLFRTTVSYWQAPRVIFYKRKGPRPGSSKAVYKSTAFCKKGLMGEIGCRRPHSTKLGNILSEIFIESVSNLCAFSHDAPNDVIYMAAPYTTV